VALSSRRSDLHSLRLSVARAAGPLALASALAALAVQPVHAQAPVAASAVQPIPDPWEKNNRKAFALSMRMDHAVIARLAHGYVRVAPGPVRAAIRRAIYNLDEPRIAGNDILQGHFERAGSAIGRFLLNSVVGIGGLFDPAAGAGLARHNSDFGQTLGRYGAGTGPYIMLPFVGPSDVRDGVGLIVDALGDPLAWATGGLTTTFTQVRGGVYVAQARVDNDGQMTALRRDFTDPYATLRAAYSQNRAFQIREARGEPSVSAVQGLPDFGLPPPAAAPSAPAAPPPAAGSSSPDASWP
jgi:phospholipid-binding lipoprotein MlaA